MLDMTTVSVVAVPLAAFGTGPGVEGLVRLGFELQRLGGKLFSQVKVLQAHKRDDCVY